MLKKILLIPIILGSLTSCTLQSSLEQTALDYNRATDRVEKEVLLLNIARAQRGEGLTFTGIAEMRGSFTVNAQGQLSLPFGGDAEAAFGFTPSAFYRTNPTIQIKPLMTAEFQRGISQGVSPETFHLLWEQGWPKEVLLHMLVESITLQLSAEAVERFTKKSKMEIVKRECPLEENEYSLKDKKSLVKEKNPIVEEKEKWTPGPAPNTYECTYFNEPDSPKKFGAFQALLSESMLRPFLSTKKGKTVGKGFTRDEIEKMKFLAEAHDGELVVIQNADETFSIKTTESSVVRLNSSLDTKAIFSDLDIELKPQSKSEKERKSRDTETETAIQGTGSMLLFSYTTDTESERPSTDPDDISVNGIVRLRSPEGMIYYLGELARAQKDQKIVLYRKIYKKPDDRKCAKPQVNPARMKSKTDNGETETYEICSSHKPLFVLWNGKGQSELEVALKGQRYFVPAGKYIPISLIDETGEKPIPGHPRYLAGQSLLVMSLVRQLFNMNTSREDLPSSQTVVTVGGS